MRCLSVLNHESNEAKLKTCSSDSAAEAPFQYSTTSRMRRNVVRCAGYAHDCDLSVLNHESNEAKQPHPFQPSARCASFQYSTTSRMRRNSWPPAMHSTPTSLSVLNHESNEAKRLSGATQMDGERGRSVFQYSTTSRMRRNLAPTPCRCAS